MPAQGSLIRSGRVRPTAHGSVSGRRWRHGWSALAVIVGISFSSWLLAADKELSPSGALHSILVENRMDAAPGPGGTRLIHRIQTPDEHIELRTVTGTDEPVLDIEPAISLSPATSLPVLVWSRQEGGSDYEIMMSLFDGVRWSTPRAISANGLDDRLPQVVWGRSGYIHLLWNGASQPDGAPDMYESILDWKGITVRPPTQVRVSATATVSSADQPLDAKATPKMEAETPETEAAAPVPPTFSVNENLLAVDSSTKFQARVSAYGGYDEPVPIVHRIDFLIPCGTSPVERTHIDVVGSRVVVFARSPGRLHYSVQYGSGWTPIRTLSLDSITEEQAEILIRGMVMRNPAN